MRWDEVRVIHPNTWLVIEALRAHSEEHQRVLDSVRVVEVSSDGGSALKRYRELHRASPDRELYFVHTCNADLVIDERPWVGVRWSDATLPSE